MIAIGFLCITGNVHLEGTVLEVVGWSHQAPKQHCALGIKSSSHFSTSISASLSICNVNYLPFPLSHNHDLHGS